VDQPLARRVDSASLEVRNFAYRAFLVFIFDLDRTAFGQTTGAFGQQQPQQQQQQQQPQPQQQQQQPQQQPAANPMFGGFGTNPSTTQTTGFGTTGGWIEISYINRLQTYFQLIRRSIWSDSRKHDGRVWRSKTRHRLRYDRSVWFNWVWVYNRNNYYGCIRPAEHKHYGGFWKHRYFR